MKQINRLHYITQEIANKPHWQLAEEACQGGAQWIQLRVKNKSYKEWLDIAMRTLAVCRQHNSMLIINDNIDIAKACQADGIHLGKTDIDPLVAREILGNDVIIGGTANTFDDILTLNKKHVDYIGLGPYQFTNTKEKLSPIIGLAGYRNIINQCTLQNISIPIIAIGGILKEDVQPILKIGIHGVSVASAIGLASSIQNATSEFISLTKLYNHELTNSR